MIEQYRPGEADIEEIQPEITELRQVESRLRVAEPARLQEASEVEQMTDTPIHPQGDKPDCLLQSARMAEHRQTGLDPGLEAFKEPAIQEGIYRPHAGITSLEKMTEIINDRPGIEAQLKDQQEPEDIEAALDRKESVIAVVDSSAYRFGRYNFFANGNTHHAVVVTSAERLSSGEWWFTVNDPSEPMPNTPIGGDRFIHAWTWAKKPMIAVK